MRRSLICDALDMAARNHTLPADCIFHSDRGSQYQCRLVNDSEALPDDIRRSLPDNSFLLIPVDCTNDWILGFFDPESPW
jgi:hypothetical protein